MPAIPVFKAVARKASSLDDRVQRTVWIGGLPSTMASDTALRTQMRRVGDVQSVHVRIKEGVNKNWALVLFAHAEHAQSLLDEKHRVSTLGLSATAGWKISRLEPTKLRSLEAQFTIAGVELDSVQNGSDPSRSMVGRQSASKINVGLGTKKWIGKINVGQHQVDAQGIADGNSGSGPDSAGKPDGAQPESPPGEAAAKLIPRPPHNLSAHERMTQQANNVARLQATLSKWTEAQSQQQAPPPQADDTTGAFSAEAAARRQRKAAALHAEISAAACEFLAIPIKEARKDSSNTVALQCAEAWAGELPLFHGMSKRMIRRILLEAQYHELSPGQCWLRKGAPVKDISIVVSGPGLQATLPQLQDPAQMRAERVMGTAQRFTLQLQRGKLRALEMFKHKDPESYARYQDALTKFFGQRWAQKGRTLGRSTQARAIATTSASLLPPSSSSPKGLPLLAMDEEGGTRAETATNSPVMTFTAGQEIGTAKLLRAITLSGNNSSNGAPKSSPSTATATGEATVAGAPAAHGQTDAGSGVGSWTPVLSNVSLIAVAPDTHPTEGGGGGGSSAFPPTPRLPPSLAVAASADKQLDQLFPPTPRRWISTTVAPALDSGVAADTDTTTRILCISKASHIAEIAYVASRQHELALQQLYRFEPLATATAVSKLALAEHCGAIRTLQPGTALVLEGSSVDADCVLLLLSGSARKTVLHGRGGGTTNLGVVEAGAVLGSWYCAASEAGATTNTGGRAAAAARGGRQWATTLVAQTDCEVLAVRRYNFQSCLGAQALDALTDASLPTRAPAPTAHTAEDADSGSGGNTTKARSPWLGQAGNTPMLRSRDWQHQQSRPVCPPPAAAQKRQPQRPALGRESGSGRFFRRQKSIPQMDHRNHELILAMGVTNHSWYYRAGAAADTAAAMAAAEAAAAEAAVVAQEDERMIGGLRSWTATGGPRSYNNYQRKLNVGAAHSSPRSRTQPLPPPLQSTFTLPKSSPHSNSSSGRLWREKGVTPGRGNGGINFKPRSHAATTPRLPVL